MGLPQPVVRAPGYFTGGCWGEKMVGWCTKKVTGGALVVSCVSVSVIVAEIE
jgi:hypothetical protein